jgi:hypothetical protein
MPFIASGALKRVYDTYNKKYFDGLLPKEAIVGTNDLASSECGIAVRHEESGHEIFVIHIDPVKHNGSRDMRLTLLHEMIHLKLFPYQYHGKRFEEEKNRLTLRGATKGLW